jgi:hypothetical protein
VAHSAPAANRHIHSLRPIRLIFTAPIDFSARRCERIRTLNRLRAEALGDLAIGIDAGEIDGPVWSVYAAVPVLSNGIEGAPLELRGLFEQFLNEVASPARA